MTLPPATWRLTFLIASLPCLAFVGSNQCKNPTRSSSFYMGHDVLGFSWLRRGGGGRSKGERHPFSCGEHRGWRSRRASRGARSYVCERTWPRKKATPVFACWCEGLSVSAVQGPGRKNLLAFVCLSFSPVSCSSPPSLTGRPED